MGSKSIRNEITAPPKDKYNLVLIIFGLQGFGTLIAQTAFLIAKSYYVDFKLNESYIGVKTNYANNILAYLGFAAQISNVIFNWVNIFIPLKGSYTGRILYSLLFQIFIFIITVALAMVDTSNYPGAFFWGTMISVVLANIANGIYQSTIYGIAAILPDKYIRALLLGGNANGLFITIVLMISSILFKSYRTAAIYYFIFAIFSLFTCFNTYFALPLNKFYKYYYDLDSMNKNQVDGIQQIEKKHIPYWSIFKESSEQIFNVYFVFFVCLAVFPAVISDIQRSSENFIISEQYFTNVTCFLTFYIFIIFGTLATYWIRWPQPKHLKWIVCLRFILIPLFLCCNYHPQKITRNMPVLIKNDWIYWILTVILSFSTGYFGSLGMIYIPQSVPEEFVKIAGMLGSAILRTGVLFGIIFSMSAPLIVGKQVK